MEAIDCDIDCDISFKDHTLTMQDLSNESGLETTIADNDENKDIFSPSSVLLETYYDYAKTEAYGSFESTAPVILNVETVKEGEDMCEEKSCTIVEESLEMTGVKYQNCKSGLSSEESVSHPDLSSSTVPATAVIHLNASSEPSEIENFDSVNSKEACNTSLQNVTRTYKRTPANLLLPISSSTPNTLPNQTKLTKNPSRGQLDESLSVSASNSIDSLKVKVQYERKFSCISRKKCSGVPLGNSHPERVDNTEAGLRSVASSNQSLEQGNKSNPANQMAYYQKLLEIRSRSGSNNKLSITITADDNHREKTDTVNITDSNDDCVLLEDTTYSCSVCSYTTDKQKTLNDHERNHRRSNKEIFNCVYCNQKYTKHALYLHVQNIHPGQKFYISQQYSAEKETVQIKATTKVKPTKVLKVHSCKLCSYSTRNKSDLMGHQKLHACGMPTKQCNLCEFRSTSRALSAHKIKHKAPRNQSEDTGPPTLNMADGEGEKICKKIRNNHCCPKCSYNSNDLSKVRSHQRVHLTNTPIIQCGYCDFRSTSGALAAHKKKFHENELGPDISSKSASRDDSGIMPVEKAHERVRADEIPALIPMDETERNEKPKPLSKCVKCAFTCQSTADLRRHVKSSHSAADLILPRNPNGLFSCDECSYESLFSSDVARHKVSHKTQPMLQCLTCDYKSTPRPLSIHVKTCPRKNLCEDISSLAADSPPEIEDYSDILRKPAVLKPKANPLSNVENPLPEIEDSPSRSHKPAGFKTKTKLFKCSQCTYSSSLRIKLNTHVKNKHPRQKTPDLEEKPQTCPHCDYNNRNSHQLEQHIKSHRSNMPTFKCGSCDFTGNTFVLRRHYLKSGHSLERKQLVSNCHVLDPTQLQLQKREKKEVQVGQLAPLISDSPPPLKPMHVGHPQVYKCSQCSFNGLNFRNFERHVKSHVNQPVFECRCGYRANRSCLKRHSKKCPLKHGRKCKDVETDPNPPVIEQQEVDVEPMKPLRTSARLSKRKLLSDGEPSNGPKVSKKETSRDRTVGADNTVKQNLWKCAECSYTAKRKVDSIHHMKSHLNNTPIKSCPKCPFRSTHTQVRIHLIQEHGSMQSDNKSSGAEPERKRSSRSTRSAQGQRACPRCDFMCSTAEDLLKHLLVHETSNEKSTTKNEVQQQTKAAPSIQCTLCSAKFLSSSGLSSHMRSHSRNRFMSKCPFCPFKSTSLALRRHICEKVHLDSGKKHEFKCHICIAGFATAVSLNQHLIEHEGNEKVGENAETRSPKKMKKQMAASASPEARNSNGQAECPDFQCDKCSYSTPLRIKLNVHKRKRHSKKIDDESSDKSHKCKIPKRNSEVLSPSNSRFNCSLCDYLATGRETLKRHELSHLSNDHPIMQCVYCKFKGTSNMFCMHQNTCPKHTDKREPFKTPQKVALSCGRCSFTTYIPSDLKNHSENCTVEVKVIKDMKSVKTFKCNYCSFTSFWQYLIDRHKQSHEVLKLPIQQCPKCHFKSTPTALSAHLKECHPGFNA